MAYVFIKAKEWTRARSPLKRKSKPVDETSRVTSRPGLVLSLAVSTSHFDKGQKERSSTGFFL